MAAIDRARAKLARKRWLVALVVGLGVLQLFPGGQEVTAIEFENDLGRSAALKLCADDACRDFDYTDDIAPGRTRSENIYFGRDAFINRWLIADASGRILGCLPIRLLKAHEHERAPLSLMVRCPGQEPIEILHSGHELEWVR